ncbi:MAG: dTMP kinase [Bacilli bacterium]|nr:dTMP kinase [Bacilli bacterium]
MRRTGIFITFEGPDGAGKTTQIRLLAEKISASGKSCMLTREPGGTAISDRIRALLLDSSCEEMAPSTEALLYAASRAQHVHEKIRPALDAGSIVLCDRYIDASIAYQAAGLGLPVEWVRRWSIEATGGLWPDRTYLIDVDFEIGQERIAGRGAAGLDRIEQRSRAYHQQVRETFLQIAKENPERVCLINGMQSMEDIAFQIWDDWCFYYLKRG